MPEAGPSPMLPVPCRVLRKRREIEGTVTLELEPVNGEHNFGFQPGQFNMLYLFGAGEAAISMSGEPGQPLPIKHSIRAAGAVTRGLCNLQAGDVIGVRGPFGRPWPVDEAEGCDVVVIAGGIGLAPLRPVVYHLLAQRQRYGRIAILYGSRSPKDLLFMDELKRWRSRFDLEVEVTVDHAAEQWLGRVGVVTTLIDQATFDPDHTVAMICGPEIMMRFCVRELQKWGVAADDIYVSMERNMACAVGFCGHCQLGPEFVCKDGPVFSYSRVAPLLDIHEL